MNIEVAMMAGLVGTFSVFVILGLIAKLRRRQTTDSGKAAAQNLGERAPPIPLVWMQSVY
jgi:hypothetical protein